MERHAITSLFVLDDGTRRPVGRHPPARPPARRRRSDASCVRTTRSWTAAQAPRDARCGSGSGGRRAGRATRCWRAASRASGARSGTLPVAAGARARPGARARRARAARLGRAGSRASTSALAFPELDAASRARVVRDDVRARRAVLRRARRCGRSWPGDPATSQIENLAALDDALAEGPRRARHHRPRRQLGAARRHRSLARATGSRWSRGA